MSETWGEAANELERQIQSSINELYNHWLLTGDEEIRDVLLEYIAMQERLEATRQRMRDSFVEVWNKTAR